MPNKTKEPQDRVREFGTGLLMVKEKKLYCKLCQHLLDHTRKSSITQHLNTKMHLKSVNRKNLKEKLSQSSLDKDYTELKNEFAQDLVKAFTESNIPLYFTQN